jgi:hypothetical protein
VEIAPTFIFIAADSSPGLRRDAGTKKKKIILPGGG